MTKKKPVVQGRLVVYAPQDQLRMARSKLVARGTTMAAYIRRVIEKLASEE